MAHPPISVPSSTETLVCTVNVWNVTPVTQSKCGDLEKEEVLDLAKGNDASCDYSSVDNNPNHQSKLVFSRSEDNGATLARQLV